MSSKRFTTIFLLSAICLLTFFPGFDLSQASLVLDGRIVKNGKELKAGEKVKMTLRIYDDEFSGKLLFEEKQEVAAGLKRALFTFEKGKITVQKRTSGLKTESLWVEVESDGQVLSPRLNLAEIGTTADLEGGSLNLRGAGLRTGGSLAMVFYDDGIVLYNRIKAEDSISSVGFSSSSAVVSGVNRYVGFISSLGGYFEASSQKSYGVYGKSSGADGRGVCGEATHTGAVENYGGYFSAAGNTGRGVVGVAGYAGNSRNYGGLFTAAGDTGRGVYGYASGANGRGIFGYASGANGKGVVGNGGSADFYAAGPGTNYTPFTGAHEVRLADDIPENIKPGLIMSVTGETHVRRDEQGKVSLSSTLATVALARKARDKEVYGVLVSITPLPEEHWYQAAAGEEFGIVNALGEGRVWVSDINGPIESGDYITTSPVPGYGQLQGDDLLHSYTLGKAIEKVDWDNVTETVEHDGETIKIYLIAVAYTSG